MSGTDGMVLSVLGGLTAPRDTSEMLPAFEDVCGHQNHGELKPCIAAVLYGQATEYVLIRSDFCRHFHIASSCCPGASHVFLSSVPSGPPFPTAGTNPATPFIIVFVRN